MRASIVDQERSTEAESFDWISSLLLFNISTKRSNIEDCIRWRESGRGDVAVAQLLRSF